MLNPNVSKNIGNAIKGDDVTVIDHDINSYRLISICADTGMVALILYLFYQPK